MKPRFQFGGWLVALGVSMAIALPCVAQTRNRPPQRQQAPRQAPRQTPQPNRRAQNGRQGNSRPGNDRAHNNAAQNRPAPSGQPANRQPESMGMVGGDRPSNARGESGQANFNPNRPPKRYQDLSPAEKRSYDQFSKLPAQKQQQMRDAARAWAKLTPGQQSHIKNDVLPAWKQLPPDRRSAISSRLNVLQNMPESARNQHLNDPNFTRGMSEEDKAMLHDLAHMHMGAPDQPNE